jgi:hypothetical protein
VSENKRLIVFLPFLAGFSFHHQQVPSSFNNDFEKETIFFFSLSVPEGKNDPGGDVQDE